MSESSSISPFLAVLHELVTAALILGMAILPSCGGKKQQAPEKKAPSHDFTGEWRSEIESSGRVVTASDYRIEQKGDTIVLTLISTKSPSGEELVPAGMWFEAKGAWQNNAFRMTARSWASGRDTCSFQLRGDMDKEGRLLLHYPADLCGGKSLPYTRTLFRPEVEVQ